MWTIRGSEVTGREKPRSVFLRTLMCKHSVQESWENADSDLIVLRWGQRFCLSNKLQVTPDVAGA